MIKSLEDKSSTPHSHIPKRYKWKVENKGLEQIQKLITAMEMYGENLE
jgi:hypothetical protein